jgi:aspartate beta-hydroxylase
VRAACPRTAEIIDRIEPMLTATGEVFFSLLHPGVVLPPHHDDSNAKLTVHLPLVVPPDCAIVVGGERRTWVEGKCLAFDDTFVHEAWNRGDRVRICLLLDVWHPCLTEVEIDALSQLSKLLFTAC